MIFLHCSTLRQINQLVNTYLSFETLQDRLTDLPVQFAQHQPRPWASIDWPAIDQSQIIGVSPEVFLSVIVGAMAVEAPIRGYATVSFQYLAKIHPPMAQFVGGTFAADGSLMEPGLWEKEERQHTPALSKVYQQLTGEKLRIKPTSVKPYLASDNPREDLYAHGLHRVATEYGATSLYLWLMAHATGSLKQVLAELVRDEVNHMTKFWGFGLWAFPEPFLTRLQLIVTNLKQRRVSHNDPTEKMAQSSRNTLTSVLELQRTFIRVMGLVAWETWPLSAKLEITFTFLRVLLQMVSWIHTLPPQYLQELLGTSPATIQVKG